MEPERGKPDLFGSQGSDEELKGFSEMGASALFVQNSGWGCEAHSLLEFG